MSYRRIWTMFRARNCEFFRDTAAFGWNFAFPFLIIIGFGIIFSGENYQRFKVGVYPAEAQVFAFEGSGIPDTFFNSDAIRTVPVTDLETGKEKLRLHKLDLLIWLEKDQHTYWKNQQSQNSYLAEQVLKGSLTPEGVLRESHMISGAQVRYIDWFFPGLMAMNMMFSALWGVGYIIVRYRKNGALKRLKATPLTAFEFLFAQTLSRIFLLMFTFVIVWIGSDLIFNFQMEGSHLLFFFTFLLGGLSLCSIGLVLAARGISEEFASGALNFISWPMMFLSEVWFSLEGAPEWVQNLSWAFPLTHMLKAARKIMNEGVGLEGIAVEWGLMICSTVIFLTLAAYFFSWSE
ncbi:MAG: ABC transporter permease [Desulfobulbaceae bacterium]|nr:MAG: ABC transporter permease [Desulfobulbaceae bacterium]